MLTCVEKHGQKQSQRNKKQQHKGLLSKLKYRAAGQSIGQHLEHEVYNIDKNVGLDEGLVQRGKMKLRRQLTGLRWRIRVEWRRGRRG